MARVLKLLNRNIIYSEPLKQVILGRGKAFVDGIKTDKGIFVYANRQTEMLLESFGESYLVGDLEQKNVGYVFFREEPRRYKQLVLGGSKDLGISLPSVKDENNQLKMDDQVDIISMLIEDHPLFSKNKLVCVPQYSTMSKVYKFNMYEHRSGLCNGVHLVHKSLGIVRLAVRHDPSTSRYNVFLERMYETFKSREHEE